MTDSYAGQYVRHTFSRDLNPIPVGAPVTATWWILNTGATSWDHRFSLVHLAEFGPLLAAQGSVNLSGIVPPGQQIAVSLHLTAPDKPGLYTSRWQLQAPDGTRFGPRVFAVLDVVLDATATTNSPPVVLPPALQLTAYSQRDERWSGERLGFGPRTIGRWGCLLTCMAMSLGRFGEQATPAELNARLRMLTVGSGFTGDSVMFAALPAAFPQIAFGGNMAPSADTGARFVTGVEEPGLLNHIDAHLAAGGIVILQVDVSAVTPYIPDADQHWVLAVARRGDDYDILDPLDGRLASLVQRYGEKGALAAIKSALFYGKAAIRPNPARLSTGMNINPDDSVSNPLAGEQLKGLDWVRFPFKAADKRRSVVAAFAEYDPIVQGYVKQGVRVLFVLNQQTVAGGNAPWMGGSWEGYAARLAEAAREIAAHYAPMGDRVAYEIWNEGDNQATPWVSVFVPPDKFGLILRHVSAEIRAAAPQARIIFGGLSTGPHQARDYVLQCREANGGQLPVDAIGIHPYGRWARQPPFAGWGFGLLEEELDVFIAAFPGMPLWITEIGIANDQPLAEAYYPAIAQYLVDTFDFVGDRYVAHVPVVIWFAWSDHMHNAGIVRADGEPKPSVWSAYLSVRNRTLAGLKKLEA